MSQSDTTPKPLPSLPCEIDGWDIQAALPEETGTFAAFAGERGVLPPPPAGLFVIVRRGHEACGAILSMRPDGRPALQTGTDFFLVNGDPHHSPWLPADWSMWLHPTSLALANLELWFKAVIESALNQRGAGEAGDDFGTPREPTVRGTVRHAHLVIRQLRLAGGPSEPTVPLDRAGYVTHLEAVRDFLRRELPGGDAVAAPAVPTAAYCLVRPNKVRWIGPPVEVSRLHWSLIRLVFERGDSPIDVEDATEEVWCKKHVANKTIQNVLSAINGVLTDIGINDWSLGIKGSDIIRIHKSK